ncbi:hypothetical protein BDY24DRAFT_375799 [Mrakia frigida]|uniref:uncharacterized protein n=1 Tax=Mrakia frigida TaxID=29902 RepID=UPI003FCC015F
MSNQSVSDEGKDRTEHKVVLVSQESRVESHLPPPLDSPSSSSSSSSLPPISHHRPQPTVASSSASGDPVAAQIAQLFSLVGRVSSENEALKAQVARLSSQDEAHSSSIARLSSENEELRKRDEEKEKTMKEMTKAFGSHWVWEAGRKEEKGRWLWSGDELLRTPPPTSLSKPPRSLDSFPTELVHSIFSLLDRSDLLALCGVSFRTLEITSSLVYGSQRLVLGSRTAAMLVGARINNPLPSPNRVSSLLLPKVLALSPSNFDAADFLPLPTGPPLKIDALGVYTEAGSLFPPWFPILNLLDPIDLSISGPTSTAHVSPTSFYIAEDELSRWTRLEGFKAVGASSIGIRPDGSSVFDACIRRCNPGRRTGMALITYFSDGRGNQEEVITEGEISSVLARSSVSDPARALVLFYAAVVEME